MAVGVDYAKKNSEGSWHGHGNPSKEQEVAKRLCEHPEAMQTKCAKARGVSPSTVSKCWTRGASPATRHGSYASTSSYGDVNFCEIANATGMSRTTV